LLRARRRGSAMNGARTRIALVVAVVVLVAGIAAAVTRSSDDDGSKVATEGSSSTSSSTTTSTEPEATTTSVEGTTVTTTVTTKAVAPVPPKDPAPQPRCADGTSGAVVPASDGWATAWQTKPADNDPATVHVCVDDTTPKVGQTV